MSDVPFQAGDTLQEEEASASISPPLASWYKRINEDWWSTILGLVLLILIITRLITGIP